MGILIRGGVPAEPREFKHMAIEKPELPRFRSPEKLIRLHSWPRFVVAAGVRRSGKTEWMLSLASVLATAEEPVCLADLTEERNFLCDQGIAIMVNRALPHVRTLMSDAPGFCDLQGLRPLIESAMAKREGRMLFDVGTNAPASCLMGEFREQFEKYGYDFHLLVNPFDPKTGDVDNVRALKLYVETLSGLAVGGLVVNAFCGAPDPRACAEGTLRAYEIARDLELDFLYAVVSDTIAETVCALLPEDLHVWSLKRLFYREADVLDDTPRSG